MDFEDWLGFDTSKSNLPLSLSFLTCNGDNTTYFSSLKNSVIPQTPINPEQQAASSEPRKEASFLYSLLTTNT